MTEFKRSLLQIAALVALGVSTHGEVINVDFNGVRHGDGGIPQPGPTYVGQSPGGGGTVWNGVLADSRLEGTADNDALSLSASNLVDSEGKATGAGLSMGPVGAG